MHPVAVDLHPMQAQAPIVAPVERPRHPRLRGEQAARLMVGTLVALVLAYGFA